MTCGFCCDAITRWEWGSGKRESDTIPVLVGTPRYGSTRYGVLRNYGVRRLLISKKGEGCFWLDL
jgi:hypothetical protein